MIGVDVSETTTFSGFGTQWQIGLLPLGKYEELFHAFSEGYRPVYLHMAAAHEAKREMPSEVMEECERCHELNTRAAFSLGPVYREFVRWGVRSWASPKPARETEPEQYAGNTYTVLKHPVVEMLGRVERGELVRRLALEVIKANTLSADEVLGFK